MIIVNIINLANSDSWIRVIMVLLQHEGKVSIGVWRPRQLRDTTWREVSVNSLNCAGTMSGKVAEGGVASRGVPFMAPLVYAPSIHTTKETEYRKHSAIDSSVWVMV